MFADSYYRDTKNPDFGILFPNGASDLDEIDWYAYIDVFGFNRLGMSVQQDKNKRKRRSDIYKGTDQSSVYRKISEK